MMEPKDREKDEHGWERKGIFKSMAAGVRGPSYVIGPASCGPDVHPMIAKCMSILPLVSTTNNFLDPD